MQKTAALARLVANKSPNSGRAIAGLWELNKQLPEFPSYESCTLIVTEGNDFTKRIGHERMPVIIHEEDYDTWLNGEEIPLVPFDSDRMTERRVSKAMNSSRNEGPECVAPPGPDED